MDRRFPIIGLVITMLAVLAALAFGLWTDWFKDHIVISVIIFASPVASDFFLNWVRYRHKLKKDWCKLADYSQSISSKACRKIPGIDKPIELSEIADVFRLLQQRQHVVVTGDAGVGKTGIVVDISQRLNKAYFIFIDSRDLCNCRSLGDINETLGLTECGLLHAIRSKAKKKDIVVVMDQCDSIWRIGGQDIILRLLENLADVGNLGIIVVCRTEESKGLKDLIRRKPGRNVGEVHVESLNKELAKEKLEALGVDNPSNELIEMAQNLFNLSLIGEIAVLPDDSNLNDVTSLWDFWEKYRGTLESEIHRNDSNYRVTDCAAGLARTCLINTNGTCEISSDRSEEEQVLISRSVLVQDHTLTQRYRFKHEKLRDYMYSFDAVHKRNIGLNAIQNEIQEQAGLVAPVVMALYLKIDSEKAAEFMSEALGNE